MSPNKQYNCYPQKTGHEACVWYRSTISAASQFCSFSCMKRPMDFHAHMHILLKHQKMLVILL